MQQELVMIFLDSEGKKRRITLSDPRTDITPAQVKTVMGLIISKDLFGGAALVDIDSAYIVTTQIQDMDINEVV